MPRIACVGAGPWGRKLCQHFHELGALAFVCEPDPAARELAAQRWRDARVAADLTTALAGGVDAVAIASPADTHGPLVREALLAGCDVLVEKPLCLSLAEGRELVALAEAHGRVLMVGHLLWYHPAVLRLQELVASGALGRIRYVHANRLSFGRIRRAEDVLWSFAPHDVSLILGLLGEQPDRIAASGASFVHEGVWDLAVASLGFPSGVRAHLLVSRLHPVKEQRLVVIGERRMAVFDDTAKDVKLRLYPYEIEWSGRMPVPRREDFEPILTGHAEPLLRECEHFLARIADRRPPRTDGREALRVLEVLDACQRKLTARSEPAAPRPDGAFVHESSYVDEDVEIGLGTRVWHFSHLLAGTRIGSGCSLGQNVVVGPRVRVGDGVKIQNNVTVVEGVTLESDVFCGPSVVFTNVHNPRSAIPRMGELRPTRVRRGASLGANATIRCGITIGAFAFVGAGAVVLEDVPDHALVAGNPARWIGWMCRCGHRIEGLDTGGPGRCRECGAAYVAAGAGLAPIPDGRQAAPRAGARRR